MQGDAAPGCAHPRRTGEHGITLAVDVPDMQPRLDGAFTATVADDRRWAVSVGVEGRGQLSI
jgi:hypothetical protein